MIRVALKLNSDPVMADAAHFRYESGSVMSFSQMGTYGAYANIHNAHRSRDKKNPNILTIESVRPQHKDDCDSRDSTYRERHTG